MAAEPTTSVFVNCPFDRDYAPLFEALIFAVADCGYRVRCSLEADNAGQVRFEKLVSIVEDCQYGVHDLSRTELNGAGLPRFNMPFELGLFLGAQRLGTRRQREKMCLVLDRERYRYQEFLSDIAGQDVTSHGGDAHGLIRVVRNWLNAATIDRTIRGGSSIIRRYEQFQAELPEMCGEFDLELPELTYHDRLVFVSQWAARNP